MNRDNTIKVLKVIFELIDGCSTAEQCKKSLKVLIDMAENKK